MANFPCHCRTSARPGTISHRCRAIPASAGAGFSNRNNLLGTRALQHLRSRESALQTSRPSEIREQASTEPDFTKTLKVLLSNASNTLMAIETLNYLNPNEICGVEFRCSHCGMKMIYSIETLDRLPVACQNCREPLLNRNSGPEYGILKNFLDATKKLQNTYFSFSFRLQLK